MANNVHSYIEFVEINDAAKAKLVEMFNRCEEMDYGRRWFADMFVEGDTTYEDVKQYSWTTEHVGPKWCYIEDSDISLETETPHLMTDSAWSPPESGLVKLLETLAELDPNMITSIRYEDEMPNFIGWSVYSGSELEDGCEDDDEEIREGMFAKYPHLKEHWDESNDEWKCDEDGDMLDESYEAEEEYREFLYEYISEMNDNGVSEAIKFIKENREEA